MADNQPQHGIAQKFKPFIAYQPGICPGRMNQGFLEKGRIVKMIPQPLFYLLQKFFFHFVCKSLSEQADYEDRFQPDAGLAMCLRLFISLESFYTL
jgi:hypothetical protein